MKLQPACPTEERRVIHQHADGRWWFDDENGERCIGAFYTEEKARRAMRLWQRWGDKDADARDDGRDPMTGPEFSAWAGPQK